jgi:hypothetical protein
MVLTKLFLEQRQQNVLGSSIKKTYEPQFMTGAYFIKDAIDGIDDVFLTLISLNTSFHLMIIS